jgi:23S rRNA G2445 N2-methylase RlmL
MCGSGTLLIEAALIKAEIVPSYLKVRRLIERKHRSWDFLAHKWFDEDPILQKKFEDKVNRIYSQTLEQINTLDYHQFYGFDRDWRALEACQENLKAALILGKVVELKQQDATTLMPPCEGPGIVVCNPPYGERIGDKNELEDLYYNYGENLKKNWKGFRAFIVSGDQELRKQISLQTSKRIPLFNGALDCRLLRYNLY